MTGLENAVRDLTDDEAVFFREHGWVHARGLVRADLAAALMAGAEGALRGSRYSSFAQYFNEALSLSHRPDKTNPIVRAFMLSPAAGRNGARLLRGEPRIRLLQCSFAAKWGEAETKPSGPTPYHQDYPGWALDRSEMCTVWIALRRATPAMGTMRFMDKSHRLGALGRSFLRADDSLPEQHPWLRDWPLSPEVTLEPGDATFHHGLTVHGAPRNALPEPRISIQAVYADAAALYNGARQNPAWEKLGLTVDQPLDHPDFPLVPAA